MILFVHTLYFVFKFALKLYRKRRAAREFVTVKDERTREEIDAHLERFIEDSLLFDPPVYRQRYAAVQQVLLDSRWRKGIRKVVDFGCAEMGFFIYMKHLFGVNEILEVDFDLDVLENYKYRMQPLTADFLSQRCEPLLVELLCGSISDPDRRLCDVDAVVGIEIIEHLFPDTLETLPYNVFGYINPRVVIFTTPNADFNVLFKNFKGFRHYDHKFEWSREQFQDWADNLCARFPEYSVTFHGIGKGPKGTESLGSCSQMAVFVRDYTPVCKEVPDETECRVRSTRTPDESFGVCTYYSYTNQLKDLRDLTDHSACDIITDNSYYKLVDSVEYPYVVDNRTPEEKLLQEAMYIIYRNATYNSRYYNEDTGMVEIPLHEIVHNFDGHFVTETEIRDLLVKAEFTVRECVLEGSNEIYPCIVYDLNMDKHSSPATSVGDKSEQEYNVNLNNDTESDWDCEYEHASQVGLSSEQQRKDEEAVELSPVSGAEPSEQLFDSGYQKSISNAEWSPTSPIDGTFEEHFNSFMKLDVNDIKENMKERRNMIAGTSCKKSPVNDCQPGTSTGEKKKKRKGKKAVSSTDDEEENADLRMLADCIVYNSLNMLHLEAEAVLPLPPPPPPLDAAVRILEPEQEAEPARYPAVENGDLANNNRDDEGNNYPDDAPLVEVEFVVDDANNANENRDVDDNAGELDDAPVLPLDQDEENRNDIPNQHEVNAEPEPAAIVDYEDDESDAAFTIDDPALNHASREALFDPNSQLDMLDDFIETHQGVAPVPVPVVIHVDHIVEDHIDVGLPNEANPFPNWLLQLLGQQVEEEEGDGNHDEPHFYCQGDGLGVHPSIIEVDVDDSTSDSSSNDEAQAEQTLSEEDVGSLPADANSDTQNMQLVGQAMPLRASESAVSNESNDEFFDTVDEEDVGNCPGTNNKK